LFTRDWSGGNVSKAQSNSSSSVVILSHHGKQTEIRRGEADLAVGPARKILNGGLRRKKRTGGLALDAERLVRIRLSNKKKEREELPSGPVSTEKDVVSIKKKQL